MPNSRMANARRTNLPQRSCGIIRVTALCPLCRDRHNAHWTGHSSRLNRVTLNESYRFGDLNYAKEELRAELASVFVAAEVGVPHDPANHAAYVGSWIKALKEDKNEIFRAAHDASAATDFVLALEREASKAEALEATEAPGTMAIRAQEARDESDVLVEVRGMAASAGQRVTKADPPAPGGDPERESTRFVARAETQSGTVAVRDTGLEADHHVPVDLASADSGGSRGDTHRPERTDGGALGNSFAAAKQVTVAKLGESSRTFTAQTQSGNYRGEIIGETNLHLVQRLSAQSTVAHMKQLLESAPKVGENVGISYSNGRASCRTMAERPKERELAR